MPLALTGVRLFLVLVFAAAGVSKLRDRARFSTSLGDLGVPKAIVPLVAVLVPMLELVAAVFLASTMLARSGAFLVTALLTVFTIVAGMSIASGRRPDCACFGAAAAEPIGPPTLLRNVALIALALLIATAGPGSSSGSLLTDWDATPGNERILSTVTLALLFGLAGIVVYASRLRMSNDQLKARVTAFERQARTAAAAQDLGAGGLPSGTTAPDFDLPRLEGDRASLTSLVGRGRPLALIFLSGHCPACHELWPDVERWQTHNADELTVAEICSGSPQTIEMKVMGHGVANVLLEGEAKIAEAYAMSLKPSAVVIGTDGRISTRSVAGVGAIRVLVSEQLHLIRES